MLNLLTRTITHHISAGIVNSFATRSSTPIKTIYAINSTLATANICNMPTTFISALFLFGLLLICTPYELVLFICVLLNTLDKSEVSRYSSIACE